MNVEEALRSRRSVRAFLDRPVPRIELQAILDHAQWAPSNCNVQPWNTFIVSGEKLSLLRTSFAQLFKSGASGKPSPEYGPMPMYEGVLQERQYGSAAALYGAMNIERGDKVGRARASLRNWAFFDAPHVAVFTMEKHLQVMGGVDVGIYAQSLALLLKEHDIASCFQASLGYFPGPIRDLIAIPESHAILFGMSFGYANTTAAANACRTTRAELTDSVIFVD
ncbi:MAG: nitroreductase [Hydrocarboniphaga sp.]|uniref:nitroreductase n=1 Tax=Hydrocarboniphaga sp. TaxID=2033016 RepID=UPI00260B8EB7|nr:nitroreductase [Hydrocarboniphaga sp.]MDB5969174.1 nitroreductase [Hydrocarboniphaga sp.]